MKMARTYARVKDPKASVELCQKTFGFKESRRCDLPENESVLIYSTLPGDDYGLELTYNCDHGACDPGGGYGHIVTAVDDLEKLHEQHKAAGLEITDLKGLPGTVPSCYLAIDPDGYKIEVIRG